jgi:4-aminobutyrate aminotransferase-like enzyme
MIAAVSRALERSPTIDEGWSSPDREDCARELIETAFAGESWVGAVRFAVTGSEANDLALSLCQAIQGRAPLITRERAYHGMVGLAREVTVQPQWHGGLQDNFGHVRPVPPSTEVRVLPFPTYSLGDGLNMQASTARDILAPAESTFDGAAAVIVDYCQGGRYSAPAYQDQVAQLARDHDVLWVADEVVTGFGKAGGWFNFQKGERRPDIVTLGKGMGAGTVPVAAVVLSKSVLEMMKGCSWQNYSALRAHPTAIAATRAFLKCVVDDDLVHRADELHPIIVQGMAEIIEKHPLVSHVDGRGLHWWVDLDEEVIRNSGFSHGPTASGLVTSAALRAGAMIPTSAERDALLLSLPLIIQTEQVEAILAALDYGLSFAERTMGIAEP